MTGKKSNQRTKPPDGGKEGKALIRDMLDCLLIGGMVSFQDIWIIEETADQIVITIGAAVLIYMGILFFREVKEWIKKYLRKSSAAQERW